MLTPQTKLLSRHQSFTLIEMLVVMAIIMILAAILIPAIGSARVRAMEADCANNLSQLGRGLYLAASERGGFYPTAAGFFQDYDPTLKPYSHTEQTNLVLSLAEFIPSNSPVWFCKRRLQKERLMPEMEMAAKRIGYFYWAFYWYDYRRSDMGHRQVAFGTESRFTTNMGWCRAGYSSNLPSLVLASDVFSNNVQYHFGQTLNTHLTDAGTLVLLQGGSVAKVSPSNGLPRR